MIKYGYVVYIDNIQNIDFLNIFIKSFEIYSEHHLYIYAINFTEENISKIILRGNYKFKDIVPEFPITIIQYHCDEKKCLKSLVIRDFISKKYADYGCYIDLNSVLTVNCDDIFTNINLITNCPISAIYPYDVDNEMLNSTKEIFNISNQTCVFLNNNVILFSNNNFDFINEWNNISTSDVYTYNIILWKFNISDKHYIPRIDYHYELFYNNELTRNVSCVYHGCKDKNKLYKLYLDMLRYYPHPLTIYDCRPHFDMIRLGKNNDGGYVIADLPDNSYDIFLSAGISDDISFEIDIQKKYDQKFNCFAYDYTIDKLPLQKNNEYRGIKHCKLNISDKNSETTTNLREYFNKYNNILLKLDIEGFEEFFIPSLSKQDMLKIKQLVIEVHDANSYIPAKITKTHYLIHVHGNNYGGVCLVDGIPIPNVYELTYLRKDCFTEKPSLNMELIPINGLDQKNGLYRPDGIHERPEILLYCKPYVNKYIRIPWVQTPYGSFFVL